MELKEYDGQKIQVQFSREEFQTLVRISKFINHAYETIDRELITINTPRHNVDTLLRGIHAIASKIAVK